MVSSSRSRWRRILPVCLTVVLTAFRLMDDINLGPATELNSVAVARPRIRVLIARSVSSSEVPNVKEDTSYLDAFVRDDRNLERSTEKCGGLKETPITEPYTNGSVDYFYPNRVLCWTDAPVPDVDASLVYFAWDHNVIRNLTVHANATSLNIEVIDVRASGSTKKVPSWLHFLDKRALQDSDYVWMVDGDIRLRTMNWNAFWQQVALLRPRIAQPTLIAESLEQEAKNLGESGLSWHPALRRQGDTRILAAEVAIIELGVPLFSSEVWLGFRERVREHEMLVSAIKEGGEQWLDAAWCHYARTGLVGEQEEPASEIKAGAATPMDLGGSSLLPSDRSCVVLYQVLIVHGNKKSLSKTWEFRKIGMRTRSYIEATFQAKLYGEKAYEVFSLAPPEKQAEGSL